MKRATETVSLFQGDDLAHLEELRIDAEAARMRYEDAKRRGGARMGNAEVSQAKTDAEAAEAAFDTFVDEAAERADEVEVLGLGRFAFRELRLEHPARTTTKVVDGDEHEVIKDEDYQFRVNTDTFPEALLLYVDPEDSGERTILKPEFPTVAALKRWLNKELTEGQYDTLWQTAFSLNSRGAIDPKAVRYGSPTTKTSSATSE